MQHSVTHAGREYPLHGFFYNVLPGLLAEHANKNGRHHHGYSPVAEEVVAEVLAAVKPVEGKKTKPPYEDALWPAGYVMEVSKNGLSASVYIQHREDHEKRFAVDAMGGVRGLVEALEKLAARLEGERKRLEEMEKRDAEEAERLKATVEGVDFTPLTRPDYWRSILRLSGEGHDSYGTHENANPTGLRRLLDGSPRYVDEALVKSVREAISTVLNEVGMLERVFRSGSWGEVVQQLAAGDEPDTALLLSGVGEVEEQEAVVVG